MVLVVFHPNIATETDHYLPIHREAPAFVEQATEQEILVTGIKVSYQFICFLLGLLAVHLVLVSQKNCVVEFCFVYICPFGHLILSVD